MLLQLFLLGIIILRIIINQKLTNMYKLTNKSSQCVDPNVYEFFTGQVIYIIPYIRLRCSPYHGAIYGIGKKSCWTIGVWSYLCQINLVDVYPDIARYWEWIFSRKHWFGTPQNLWLIWLAHWGNCLYCNQVIYITLWRATRFTII